MTPYGHLNVSDNLAEALRSVSETEWKKFFESVQQYKLQQMLTIDKESLTKCQGEANMVTEIQGIFLGLRQSAKIEGK